MVSDALIKSLHTCFRHNGVEISIRSFAASRGYKVLQSVEKRFHPLLLGCGAVFVGVFAFAYCAPLAFLSLGTTVAVSLLCVPAGAAIVFKFLPEFMRECETVASQGNEQKVETVGETVELLERLLTYPLPHSTKNALGLVVERLNNEQIASSTWRRVNECLREIEKECERHMSYANKDHNVKVAIGNLERKLKPPPYNILQL